MGKYKYNSNVNLNYIKKIAHADWIGARILWNLGIIFPSLHLLHESIEKYLKVLWGKDKDFKSNNDLHKELKKFGHRFEDIFKALASGYQKQLNKCLNKYGLRIYHLEALRYGTEAFIGYSDTRFSSAERFIKEIRLLLGDNIKENLLEEFSVVSHPFIYKKNREIEEIMKKILGLKRTTSTKKTRKDELRRFRAIISKSIPR